LKGELILIIEDEANIIELDRLYLEREGFTVKSAMDGQAGLQAIERLHPALVVLDIMLPVMDGLAVCQALRVAKNSVPVIMAIRCGRLPDQAVQPTRIGGAREGGAASYSTRRG